MTEMNMDLAPDDDVSRLIEEVLADHWDPAALELGGFDADLWATLGEVGLARLTGAEEHGGSESGWPEAGVLAARTGFYATSVPVVEHDLLAGWLTEQLAAAGTEVRTDVTVQTVAVVHSDGRATQVPWAPVADAFIAVWPSEDGWSAAQVDAGQLEVTETPHLANRPTGDIRVDLPSLTGTQIADEIVMELHVRAGLARALQCCGAMERIIDLAREHVTTRVQFGRALSKFQAVQFKVADMAAEAALARVATEAALRTVLTDGFASDNALFAVAAARSCVGHAVSTVVRNGHQVHGAIGTTVEHSLHRFTRPLLAWRSEWGSTQQSDRFLAEQMVRAGSDGAWEQITLTTNGSDHR